MKKPSKTIKKIRFRPTLFWDVDPKTIDPKKHARYVIERIMQFGNDQEVNWMWHFYKPVSLRNVVDHSRSIDPQTKNLWKLLIR